MDSETVALDADNRAMLTGEIPALLSQLYSRLDIASLEPWHSELIRKLIANIGKNCQELLRSLDQEWLSETAWIARNLLELWIWANFCAASREHARRFYEDALRDMKGLCDSLNNAAEARGGLNVINADTALAEVASTKLGILELDAKFLNVAEAAKAVGLDDWYGPRNRILSKFAHPTAGLVIGIAHQEAAKRGMQTICATQGVFFARNALAVFDERSLLG